MTLFLKYLNQVFIETGSYHGGGIRLAINAGFNRIISIESRREYVDECSSRFSSEIASKRVNIVFGKSEEVLSKIMDGLNDRATFWLDAHPTTGCWDTGTFPLKQEIDAICRHKIKDHTILIDDVRIFNYFKISQGWIIEKLLKNNPEYVFSYDTLRADLPNDVMVIKV